MNIEDPSLKKHVESAARIVVGCPDHLRPILGLFDALDFFYIREGEQSSRVQEAIRHLLSEELRPALRDWYRRAGNDINPGALEWRNRISKLAGEDFGKLARGPISRFLDRFLWRRGRRLPVVICLLLIAAWGLYGLIAWWGNREQRIFYEEVLRPLHHPHHNEEGWWVGDITENYRLGVISRKLAEADTAPLNPLVPKPVPIHGYYVRAMNSGPTLGPTPVSLKGLKRSRESYAILIYPAEPALGKPTWLYSSANEMWRHDFLVPTFEFPTDEERMQHWGILD